MRAEFLAHFIALALDRLAQQRVDPEQVVHPTLDHHHERVGRVDIAGVAGGSVRANILQGDIGGLGGLNGLPESCAARRGRAATALPGDRPTTHLVA